MKKLRFLLLLIASFAYSQEHTIKFETEIEYKLDRQDKIFCISKKNPETILVKSPVNDLKYLMQKEDTYNIKVNSNGKIDYNNSSFQKKKDEGNLVDITPTDVYEDVLNLKCQKFIFNDGGLGFEVFIAVDYKIDNTSFLYSNFKINKQSFNTKGLITKLNIVSKDKSSAILMIQGIKEVESKLLINDEYLKKLTLVKEEDKAQNNKAEEIKN